MDEVDVQSSRAVLGAFVLAVALAPGLLAQVQAGPFKLNLTGNLSAGYTGDYGNLTPSAHGLALGGAATLSGSYYDPNFLSFTIAPFYNQSRSNSDYLSTTNASGVIASTALFSGSSFPGSINYSAVYNAEGSFGVPGLANFTSHGNSQSFAVNWGEHMEGLPSLNVNYQQGSNDYTVYGATSNSQSDFHGFGLSSAYTLAGFNLTGSFQQNYTDSTIPALFAGETPQQSNSETTSVSVGISHRLPWNGSFFAGGNRTDLAFDSGGAKSDTTLDLAYSSVIFNPTKEFSFGATGQYLNNLSGAIEQAIIGAGGAPTPAATGQSSHSLSATGFATYVFPSLHLSVSGSEQHTDQLFEGDNTTSDALTGRVTYSDWLWGGPFTATAGVVHTQFQNGSLAGQNGQGQTGLLGSVYYSRDVGRWNFHGNAQYSQDQQTLLASTLNTSYGFSGFAGRRIARKSYWSASASGSRSSLSGVQGSTSDGQSYATSINLAGKYSTAANYSRSSGNSILTANGLVPTPVPLPGLNPTAVVLYGGQSYGVSASAMPRRGVTLSVSYSHSMSNTVANSLNSNNKSDFLIATLIYQVRKVYLNAGFTKINQSLSGSGGPPSMTASYYVGITRWFHFF